MQTPSTSYRGVFYQPGPEPVFCYRTGLTVYEESFSGGALLSRGWNTAGYPLNVLSGLPTRLNPASFAEPQAFRLDIDGEYCDWGLTFVSFTYAEEANDHTHAVLTLRCADKAISIRIHTVLDGTPILTRWLKVTNEGAETATVSALAVMNGGIETMGQSPLADGLARMGDFSLSSVYRLGYFDATGWGMEGDFAWHDLTPDEHAFGGRYARSRFRQPFFVLQNTLMGTTMIGEMGWSAGYRFAFDYNAHPEMTFTNLAYRLEVDGPHPLITLSAGETLTSPKVHVGMLAGGLDEAVNAMHDHTRKTVFQRPSVKNPCLVGAGMGAEHDMSRETTLQFIDQMARAGAEVFIVDAGWYCPPNHQGDWYIDNGNWKPDPDRYPNGIAEIRDYCASRGLRFGLWVEPERIGSNTAVYREHPEWLVTRRDGYRGSGFLDFTNEDAAAWAEAELARIITEYKLDLLRVDYNVEEKDKFHVGKRENRRECRSIRHMQNVYAMFRRLKDRFPDVVFENCAGGGGRCDLGIMENFSHTWVSDRQTAPRAEQITNGMTMVLPPDRVDRLVAGMGSHVFGTLDFQMRAAMFGHISLNVFSPRDAEMNPNVFDFIRHSTDLYKSFIRPFLPQARFYHHTPETKETQKACHMLWEIASPDQSRDVIGVFTMPGWTDGSIVVRPRGLDAGRRYRVTFDNSGATIECSGYALAAEGIHVSIPSAMASELILLEAIENTH